VLCVALSITFGSATRADEPGISAEMTMDDPVPGLWNVEEFYGVDVATNGENHLVIWSAVEGAYGELWGARIDGATGEVLDPQGIQIGSPFDDKGAGYAAVASNGTDYLVVWWHLLYYIDGDVYAARVSGSGVLIDEEPIPIAVSVHGDEMPLVASAGDDYLVVWRHDEDDPWLREIRAALVASDSGEVSPAVAMPTVYDMPAGYRVASDGTDYFVAWLEEESVVATRVDGTDGQAIDDPPLLILDQEEYFELASNGTNYLFGYTLGGSPVDNVSAILVDGALGTVINGNIGITDAWEEGFAEKGEIRVASDGTDFMLTWSWVLPEDYHTAIIRGTRIDGATGDVIDAEPVEIHSQSSHVSKNAGLSYASGSYYSVWEDADGLWQPFPTAQHAHVEATRVDSGSMAVLDDPPTAVGPRANRQENPAVAFDGSTFLAVWTDYRDRPGNETDVYGVRLDAEGNVLDPEGIAICTAPWEQEHVAVAAVEGTFMVIWYDDRDAAGLYAARISAGDGEVLDPNGVQLHSATGNHWPAIASNGERFLVAWPAPGAIYGIWLDAGSAEGLDPGQFHIASWESDVAVASDGEDFMVVWTDDSDQGEKVNVTPVAASGEEPVGAPVPLAPEVGGRQYQPTIAFDGERYLVSWMDYYHDMDVGFTGDIASLLVGADGLPLDGEVIDLDSSPGMQLEPISASDGTTFAVAYYSCEEIAPDTTSFLCETRVKRVRGGDGAVLDEDPMALSGGPEGFFAHRLFYPGMTLGDDAYLVAYNNLQGGLPRISANLISRAPCEIGGESYAAGDVSPDDQCQLCAPEWSVDSWTQAPVGTPCDDGDPETVDDVCLEDGTCAGNGPDAGSNGGSSSRCDCRHAGGSVTVGTSVLDLVLTILSAR